MQEEPDALGTDAPAAGDASPARPENRGSQVLDAAARLFSRHGYDGTSIRDIAALAEVQPASVYYHYPSKDALLIAVLQEGVRFLTGQVLEAVARETDPWRRLEAACATHMEALLHGNDYVQVLSGEIPSRRAEKLQRKLVEKRDTYENIFRRLVDDLPVASRVSRKYLRLTLLGAMGWSVIWYRPDGDDSPAGIARWIVELVRHGAQVS